MLINRGKTNEDILRGYLASRRAKPVQEEPPENSTPVQEEPVVLSQNIILVPSFIKDPENYIGIPQFKKIISKRERHKRLNFEETIKAVAQEGISLKGEMFMPTIPYFMQHFFNVIDAHEGKIVLYDGRGNPISKDETEKHFKYFTSGFESGAWTWLDAYFAVGSGFNNLDIRQNHRVDSTGNITFKQTPLEACIQEDCFVDIAPSLFNKQYLPTAKQKSQSQAYTQGKNVRFLYPRENSVAGFYAYSDRSGLDCGRDPSGHGGALGVFVCAEGATKNQGGKTCS